MKDNFKYYRSLHKVKYKHCISAYYNYAMLSFDALVMMGVRVNDLMKITEIIKKRSKGNEIPAWDWLIRARKKTNKIKHLLKNKDSQSIRNELLKYYTSDDIRAMKRDNKNIRRLFYDEILQKENTE